MSYQAAADLCLSIMSPDSRRFYGPAHDLPLGAGMLLSDCPLAIPDEVDPKYRTALGYALVLTHECDIDQDNARMFNQDVLLQPVLPLEIWCASMDEDYGVGSWGGLLPRIAANEVFRVMYLPPIPDHFGFDGLKYGGFTNLNTITSAPLSWFDHFKTKPVCSLSAIGLRAFDFKMTNHLLRAKSVRLWASE